MDNETKQYFGGLPTAPHVKVLLERFKDLSPGDEIKLSVIAEVTGIETSSRRFRSILDAFRRALRVRNLVTERPPGQGMIRVVPNDERTGFGVRGVVYGTRKIRRSVAVISTTPTEALTEDERNTNFHARRLGEALVETARSAVREIFQAFASPNQLPRREKNGPA